jgi:hypothetical protein
VNLLTVCHLLLLGLSPAKEKESEDGEMVDELILGIARDETLGMR